MNAKSYLSRLYRLNCDIEKKRGELERLTAVSEKTSPAQGTPSVGQTSDRVGKCAARIVDLEKELRSMKKQYARLYAVTERRINAVSGENEREILRQRYLYFRSWRTIGNILKMNHVLVQYYHKKALENFSEIFSEKA